MVRAALVLSALGILSLAVLFFAMVAPLLAQLPRP